MVREQKPPNSGKNWIVPLLPSVHLHPHTPTPTARPITSTSISSTAARPPSRILLLRFPSIADKTESSGSDVTKKIGGETRERGRERRKGGGTGKGGSRVELESFSPGEAARRQPKVGPSGCGVPYRRFHVLLRV
ncbi:hypothetical protein GQ55_3G219600 [Panicum hallii var. hallii]|uniref:Uncharacterized protein n=1 Tax=Panicum hallii var. hallii TaxID=1504633 RepID=A0A2T7EC45_9POAL|nr:hypothetical protein GQ55_3G219600 [Panicum hallii var. hallii]